MMVTIELTDEEFYLMKDIMQRIFKQKERKLLSRKWIKHDGCMINLETGSMLDISSNKFVIDQAPDLKALIVNDKVDCIARKDAEMR